MIMGLESSEGSAGFAYGSLFTKASLPTSYHMPLSGDRLLCEY
jgi:hypothetical protein